MRCLCLLLLLGLAACSSYESQNLETEAMKPHNKLLNPPCLKQQKQKMITQKSDSV